MVIRESNKILVNKIMEVILLLPGATVICLVALVFEVLFILELILACAFHNMKTWVRFPALGVCAAVPVFSVWLLLDKWQSCFERQS